MGLKAGKRRQEPGQEGKRREITRDGVCEKAIEK
jgi:hypothetical protein